MKPSPRDFGILVSLASVLLAGILALILNGFISYRSSTRLPGVWADELVDRLSHAEAVGSPEFSSSAEVFAWGLKDFLGPNRRLPDMSNLDSFARSGLIRTSRPSKGDVVVLGMERRERIGVISSLDSMSYVVIEWKDGTLTQIIVPRKSPRLWEAGALRIVTSKE